MNTLTRTIPREVTQREIGYLAGIIDGEGSIGFGKTKSKSVKKGYNLYNGIYIVNTNIEMLERVTDIINRLCHDLIDGRHSMNKLEMKTKLYNVSNFVNAKNPKEYKSCYQITLRNKEWTIRVIENILPDLTEKRKRAVALLEILKERVYLQKEATINHKKAYYDEHAIERYMNLWENARRD